MRLVLNELYRFYKNRNTWLIVFIIFVATVGYATLMIKLSGSNTPSAEWRTDLEQQIAWDNTQLATLSPSLPMHKFLSAQISVNEYRLTHNLPPTTTFDLWTLLNEIRPVTTIITLVAIVLAANAIAAKHAKGTIKFIITSPIRRGEFLLLKYIAVVVSTLLLFAAFLLFTLLLGFSMLGTDGSDYYLSLQNGIVTQMPIEKYVTLKYLATIVNIIMVATLAFTISVLFRSSILAVSVSLLLYFTGTTATQFFALKFSWIKYSIFANYDLTTYLDGIPPVAGMTLPFSLSMLVAYLALFLAISYFTFTRRDIKA